MAKDYAKSANTALKLIKKFGMLGAVVRNEGILINNAKPWQGDDSAEVNYVANVALVPISAKDQTFLPAILAKRSVSTAYIDAVVLSITPDLTDKVLHDGIYWQIETVEPLKPADVNIVWQCVVSR
jgi:hypothetical protein